MSQVSSGERREKPKAGSDAAVRLEFVDGLRGLAVIVVMLRHYYMEIYEYGLPRWSDVLGLGYLGVHLFLLLSGFCVSWAYLGTKSKPFELSEFVMRRATRILPAYYVALALSVALFGRHLGAGELVWQLATHLTMTHNFFFDTVLALNGPFWSLALESQLYVFFPFLLLGFRRIGVFATLAIVLAAQLAYRFWALRFGTSYSEVTFVIPWGVLGRLFEFGLGMWGASLVARDAPARAPLWVRIALPVAMLVAFVAARGVKSRLGVTHPLTDCLWTIGFFCLLLSGSTRGWATRLLSYGPLVRLGVASYSVYLIHALVLGSVTRLTLQIADGALHPLLLTPVVFGVTLIPCYAFYRVVERPAIDYFRRRVTRRAIA